MEAPDKIYVPQHNIEAGSIYELCEFVVGGSVEYIRKDALLEWAKAVKADPMIPMNIDKVIEKIQSR